jgi:phosphoribosylanthranilate isomerase
MQRTRVKICGITCVEDALLAARAGADAIGLIFHPPAARGVAITTAEEIIASIPPFVTPVGLLVNSPAASIVSLANHLRLQWIQLHGRETPADVKELADFHIIKAVHVLPDKLRETLAPWREAAAGLPNLKAIALETGWASAQGGTGIENDWQQIRQIQAEGGFDDLPPLILAGGLRPSTVGGVIEMLRPWAVDVSSGVEETKGRKSPERVAAFIKAVHGADRNCDGIPST